MSKVKTNGERRENISVSTLYYSVWLPRGQQFILEGNDQRIARTASKDIFFASFPYTSRFEWPSELPRGSSYSFFSIKRLCLLIHKIGSCPNVTVPKDINQRTRNCIFVSY